MPRMKKVIKNDDVECIYCGAVISKDDDFVPKSYDTQEWKRMAAMHDETCEWILTRAHMMEDE